MPHHHHHHHHHGNYQASNGLKLMFLGALIGAPLIFWFGFFQYTTPSTMVIAAVTATSSALFSFGISALILYASIGAAYLCSAAHECYKTDKGPLDILKSRILNQDRLNINGFINSIGAALWSPFVVLGGLSGMAVKAMISAFTRSSSAQATTRSKSSYGENSDEMGTKHCSDFAQKSHHQEEKINLRKASDSLPYPKGMDKSSYSTLMAGCRVMDTPQSNQTNQKSSVPPISISLYSDIKPNSDERKPDTPRLSCR